MADLRGFDRLGNKITFSEDQRASVEKLGGRVATPEELAEHEVEARYAALSAPEKALGVASTIAGAAGGPLAFGGDANAPPTVAAYGAGVRHGLTAGLDDVAGRKLADAVGGKEAGDRYAREVDQRRMASPIAHGAGALAGMVGGAALGEAGAAAALPSAGAAALGRVVESTAGKALSGLAAQGAAGRAASTAGTLGARAALEGGLFSGVEAAAEQALHDEPVTGEKLYAALGHGALVGGGLGSGLGALGSLAMSGARSLQGKGAGWLSAKLTEASNAEARALLPPAPEGRPVTLKDIDAGLHAPSGPTESPIAITKHRGITLDTKALEEQFASIPNGGAPIRTERSAGLAADLFEPGAIEAAESPIARRVHLGAEPDASSAAARDFWLSGGELPKGEAPVAPLRIGKMPRVREADLAFGDEASAPVFLRQGGGAPEAPGRMPLDVRLGIDPDAGLRGPSAAGAEGERLLLPRRDALRLSERRVAGIDPDAGLATEEGARKVFGVSKTKSTSRVGLGDVEERGLVPASRERPIDLGAPPEPPPVALPIAEQATNRARAIANDLAWDSLGTTKAITSKVHDRVKGGSSAVGDWLLRRVTKSTDPSTSWSDVFTKSRSDELLPLIEAELAADGRRIGEEVAAYNLRVKVDDVKAIEKKLAEKMLEDPTRIQGVGAFQERVASMFQAFGNARQIGRDNAMSLSDLYYARAKMEGVAHELNRGSAAHEAFKTFLRRVDDMLVDRLDDAAKMAGAEGGSRIRELKREYQLGSWAKRAAEDGTNRIKGNNIIGLRAGAGAFVGLATGHPVAALGTAVAGKLLKERGAAMGAHLLAQAAERGTVARAVQRLDESVRSAATGVLKEGSERAKAPRPRGRPPKRLPQISGREQQKKTVQDGQEVVGWVARVKSDPTAFRRSIEDAASVIASSAGPKAADRWVTTAIRAFDFVAARVPDKPRLDPLDPASKPPLTFDEADRLVTAAKYATEPMAVWKDLERGVVTADAVAAAQAFMPDAWADFQMHLYEHLETQVSRNVQLSSSQRLRIYRLLGVPAGADMRPEMVRRYQANFTQQGPGAGPAKPAGGARKPIDLKTNQSAFDRAEARATG